MLWCLRRPEMIIGPFLSADEADEAIEECGNGGVAFPLSPDEWQSFSWIDRNSRISNRTKEVAKEILGLFRDIGAFEPSGATNEDGVVFLGWPKNDRCLEIEIHEDRIDLFVKCGETKLLLTSRGEP